jgi:NAD(P)-dependent dehydrogenase (short-subunit alcohol dehydrogenase family)
MTLQGRVALITGASQGIGRATALLLARQGVAVGLAARTRSKLELVKDEIEAAGGQALVAVTDTAVPEDNQRMVQAVLDRFGRLDILVCAAGIFTYGYVAEHDDQAWLDLIKVNLFGVYLSNKAALRPMLQQKWGRIVNVSATSAFVGSPGWSAQCSAKTGMLGLTRSLALEVAAHGITANCICPAWVDTPSAEEASRIESAALGIGVDQYWKNTIEQYYPMGRITRAEEHAHLILYLVSEEAAALTGQAIPLTAGSPW